MNDVDGTRGAFNFFRADSLGHAGQPGRLPLAAQLRRRRGGGIVEDLRYAGYGGPVVLEEFGYPSDPYPRSPTWTEGAPVCRIDPAQAGARRPRRSSSSRISSRCAAGATPAAWPGCWPTCARRTADRAAPASPSTYGRGSFAIGGTYCDGGTYSRALGQPKATAVRVCAYYADDLGLCEPGVPPKRRMYFQWWGGKQPTPHPTHPPPPPPPPPPPTPPKSPTPTPPHPPPPPPPPPPLPSPFYLYIRDYPTLPPLPLPPPPFPSFLSFYFSPYFLHFHHILLPPPPHFPPNPSFPPPPPHPFPLTTLPPSPPPLPPSLFSPPPSIPSLSPLSPPLLSP